jgi:hypothetical protein
LVVVVGALRAVVRTALAAVAGLAVNSAARATVVLAVALTGRLPVRSSWGVEWLSMEAAAAAAAAVHATFSCKPALKTPKLNA